MRPLSCVVFALFAFACGDGEDNPNTETQEAEIPCQYSTAFSSGSCQVNLFCETSSPAAYCDTTEGGEALCSCGAAVDDPPTFTLQDFCDFETEVMVKAAMEHCENWTFE